MDDIIRNLFKVSRPAECPPWPFLCPSPNLSVFDGSPADLAKSFEEQYAIEPLLAAGAYVNVPGAGPRLSPVLAATNRPFTLLKDERRSIFDVVNQVGSLRTADPPAFNCCVDHWARKIISKVNTIFAPLTDADFVLLRLLRIPCTPAANLSRITVADAERLFDRRTLGDRPMLPYWPPGCKLVLVGCQLSQLSPELPPELLNVIRRIRSIEANVGLLSEGIVEVWRPTEDQLQLISEAAQLGMTESVRKQIRTNAKQSTFTIAKFQEQFERKPQLDLISARRQLQQDLQHCFDTNTVWPSLAKSVAAYESALIAAYHSPWQQCAAREVDPGDQVLYYLAARCTEFLPASDPLLCHAKEVVRLQALVPNSYPRPEQLPQLTKVINEFVKIHHEFPRDR